MVQFVQIDVVHEAATCPAAQKESLVKLIGNLEKLADTIDAASTGKINIVADWYERNAHVFHYLLEVTDLRIAEAEDVLKQAIGLPDVTVRSYPTESGEQAVDILRHKLDHLS